MFTGLIEATAEVLSNTGDRMTIQRPAGWDDVSIGSSICVLGVCLSIVELDEQSMTFDITEETQNVTSIGTKKEGSVNLERALKADARLEGHIVQGHVECTAKVHHVDGENLVITLPREVLPFVVLKGSIAIDGVSLTVAKLEEDTCTIALIPHTIEHTTIGTLTKGDVVNIETDVLAKYGATLQSSVLTS